MLFRSRALCLARTPEVGGPRMGALSEDPISSHKYVGSRRREGLTPALPGPLARESRTGSKTARESSNCVLRHDSCRWSCLRHDSCRPSCQTFCPTSCLRREGLTPALPGLPGSCRLYPGSCRPETRPRCSVTRPSVRSCRPPSLTTLASCQTPVGSCRASRGSWRPSFESSSDS